MISDMMDVHNAFLASFENAVSIDGAFVPSRFFNPQPSQSKTPKYPSIVIQPMVPRPSNRVWVESTEAYNAATHEVVERKPPKRYTFRYQVSVYASRFDHAVKLSQFAAERFPDLKGQAGLKIDGDMYDVSVVGQRDLPSIDAGAFRTDFDYELYVPVYSITPEVLTAIQTWTLNTIETTEDLDN